LFHHHRILFPEIANMQSFIPRAALFATLALIGISVVGSVVAQSGTRRAQPQRRQTAEEFQERFWRHLASRNSGYRTWSTWPGKEGLREGQSPHGAYVRIFANSAATSEPDDPPTGSFIVKENFGDEKKSLMAITVMYRSKGYDPKHNDWYWIKYLPDGTVDRMPEEMGGGVVAGRVKMCIECHQEAKEGDYVFAND
jgi:hypothetical protein